ncbi:MAG: GAF domain-containing protein [Gammaproteobacteria bacterium]|nr:GAF domain-containing protein [Gammaproteobacteria bacterium]NIM73810.1 GAF domain-containing protein [Gammaproteobacteria bacterium]NIN39387.1 GAF domain-containing protein [Gammaproteobacteria bacterium]NIO25052.1 GAF domain-containing protein [Gammaproteobacteria bacterium]NIO65684.1 GAF domain-containing protein [Gammaproteobacteria bacterium]
MTDTQLSEQDWLERLEALREENLELEQEADVLRQFMDSMVTLIEAIESPTGESEALGLLARVLESAIRAIGARDGSLLIPDEETGELVFVLVQGEATRPNLIGRRLPAGRGIAGWVAENRRGAAVNNVPADERFYAELDVELDYRTSSMLAAPLLGGNRLLGVVEVINKQNGQLFSTGNLTVLTLMCRFAGELLNRAISKAELTQSMKSVGQA